MGTTDLRSLEAPEVGFEEALLQSARPELNDKEGICSGLRDFLGNRMSRSCPIEVRQEACTLKQAEFRWRGQRERTR